MSGIQCSYSWSYKTHLKHDIQPVAAEILVLIKAKNKLTVTVKFKFSILEGMHRLLPFTFKIKAWWKIKNWLNHKITLCVNSCYVTHRLYVEVDSQLLRQHIFAQCSLNLLFISFSLCFLRSVGCNSHLELDWHQKLLYTFFLLIMAF